MHALRARTEVEPPNVSELTAFRGASRVPRASLALVLVLSFAPIVVQGIRLFVDVRAPVFPYGDLALLELSVRDVGHHWVLLGPYSRYQFNHPGPLLFYVLAVPYRLLGARSMAVGIGALAVNGVSGGGILLIAWRRGGRLLLIWAAFLFAVWMRFLGAQTLQHPWNPLVTILPFGLFVIVAWRVSCGSLRAVPAAVLLASFVVQTHISYLPSVAVVLGLAVVLAAADLIGGWRRAPADEARRKLLGDAACWLGVALLVALVVWLPPLVEQVSHDPGNLTKIQGYFNRANPSQTPSDGVRVVIHQLGALPRSLFSMRPAQHRLADSLALGIVTLAAFAGGIALALLRRAWDVIRLAVLTVALFGAAVVSVSNISGPFEPYLVTWISAASFAAWFTVGAAAFASQRAPTSGRHVVPPRVPVRPSAAIVVALLVPLSVVSCVDLAGAVTVRRRALLDSSVTRVLAQRVINAVPRDHRAVLVTSDLEQWPVAAGVVLQLERHGIAARVPADAAWLFGTPRAVHPERAGTVVMIVSSSQPPPRREGQLEVADVGGVAAYVAPREPGNSATSTR